MKEYREGKLEVDAFILDIEMSGMNGIELAKEIRRRDLNVLIIFVTGHSNYVFDVFETITFDFIIKPVTKEKIVELVKKVKEFLFVAKKKFVFCYNKSTYSIPYDEIIYLEKMKRKIYIHTSDENTVYQSNMNLKEVWNRLDEKMFANINKSCIVNLGWISRLDSEYAFLENDMKFYVSREYRKELRERHLRYLEVQL